MIELNKVYADGNYFITPVAVRGNRVVYWLCALEKAIGEEEYNGSMSIEAFEKTHTLYVKPMTFQRIKDEGIKNLVDASGETREVVGFSSNGKLVAFNENRGASSWHEEEIKDWMVAE